MAEEIFTEEQFWRCPICGMDNAPDNDICCACDSDKPENIDVKEEKNKKKNTLIKNEAYTEKVVDLFNDLKDIIIEDSRFYKKK